jgi:hypothetical protein
VNWSQGSCVPRDYHPGSGPLLVMTASIKRLLRKIPNKTVIARGRSKAPWQSGWNKELASNTMVLVSHGITTPDQVRGQRCNLGA